MQLVVAVREYSEHEGRGSRQMDRDAPEGVIEMSRRPVAPGLVQRVRARPPAQLTATPRSQRLEEARPLFCRDPCARLLRDLARSARRYCPRQFGLLRPGLIYRSHPVPMICKKMTYRVEKCLVGARADNA
jgi:hypothetical protein